MEPATNKQLPPISQWHVFSPCSPASDLLDLSTYTHVHFLADPNDICHLHRLRGALLESCLQPVQKRPPKGGTPAQRPAPRNGRNRGGVWRIGELPPKNGSWELVDGSWGEEVSGIGCQKRQRGCRPRRWRGRMGEHFDHRQEIKDDFRSADQWVEWVKTAVPSKIPAELREKRALEEIDEDD